MSVYKILEDEDLSTDEGIEKACQKITSAEVAIIKYQFISEDFLIYNNTNIMILQDVITKQLENLLSRQNHIESKLMSISQSKGNLQVIYKDAVNLESMINNTANLAENVSAKVRRLDEARVCILFLFNIT